MNSDTICSQQVDLADTTERAPITRILNTLPGFFAHLQNAQRVEQQAKRLYTMSDADLHDIGMTREDIPSHLSSQF